MKLNKKITIFVLVITMLLMTGCTRQEYNVNITDQNGVILEIKALVDKESYNLLSTFNVDLTELEENKVEGTGSSVDKVNPLFQEAAMQFKSYGFEITEVNDAVEIGFSAKKNYLTIEEFNAEIKELCDNNLSGLLLDIQYEDTKNNKEYKAYGALNYVVDKDLGFDDETIKGYFDKQYETAGLTCRVTIQMPLSTQITASDGVNSVNGAMEWQTSYDDGEKEVHVISEYHNYSMYYIIAFIVFIILLVVGFFALRSLKFKKEKQNSALKEEYEYEQYEQEQSEEE